MRPATQRGLVLGIRMFEAMYVVPAERRAWLQAGFEPSVALNYLSAGATLDDAVEWRNEGSDANTYARFRSLLRSGGLVDGQPRSPHRAVHTCTASTDEPAGPLVTVHLQWHTAPGHRARPGCEWAIWAPSVVESPFRGRYEVVCTDLPPDSSGRAARSIGLGTTLHRTLRGALQHIGESAFVVRGQLSVSVRPDTESARPFLLEALPRLAPVDHLECELRRSEHPDAPDYVVLE